MNFADTQLQACFDLNLADQAGGITQELRQVGALIATHDWFRMLEGSHSPRVNETVERLLSPGMRPGLHQWYGRPSANQGTAAIEFREQLNQLAGERLEKSVNLPVNPA